MTFRHLAPRILARLRDPYGFAQPLGPLPLHPHDLPGWSRESRLDGGGC